MGFLKIIAGLYQNKIISTVNSKKMRPFSEKTRALIFLTISKHIVNANILDLFSGSGICSFESVSRGALSACLIDNDKTIVNNLYKNIHILSIAKNLVIYIKNVKNIIFFFIKIT